MEDTEGDQQDHYRAFATPEQAFAALTVVQQGWDRERDQIEKAFKERRESAPSWITETDVLLLEQHKRRQK